MQVIVTIITYSTSIFFSGGVQSPFVIFAPFMPVFAGLLTGAKGAVFFTLYLSLYLIILAIYGDKLQVPHIEGFLSNITLAIEISCALFSIGVLIFIYEAVVKKSEAQLLSSINSLHVTKQKLIESDLFLKNILANIPLMIVTQDYKNNGKISLVNKSAEEVLGVSSRFILGKSIFDFLPSEKSQTLLEIDKEVFTSRAIKKIDAHEFTFSGKQRTYTSWRIPTFDAEGNPHLLISIYMDITEDIHIREELKREQAKSLSNAKLASLGAMSAGIAHEINNPLAIISGSLSRLRKNVSVADEKGLNYLAKIEHAFQRISKIVNGLMRFSGNPDKPQKFDAVPLKMIIDEAINVTKIKAYQKAIEIDFDCQTSSHIFCSAIEIEQVFINLIYSSPARDLLASSQTRFGDGFSH